MIENMTNERAAEVLAAAAAELAEGVEVEECIATPRDRRVSERRQAGERRTRDEHPMFDERRKAGRRRAFRRRGGR